MENKTDTAAPKKENKVLNTIVNIILVLVILFAIFCGYSAYVTKAGSGVPSIFGIRVFAIQSDSMKPTFSKGDLVISKAIDDPSKLKVGDIITFWTVIEGERVLNTHRIVGIEDCGTYYSYTTKGDNNTIEDGLTVHSGEVVGKYVGHIPFLGSFIDFLQTSKGFFICIVVPIALFFIYYLVQFFKALFAYQAEKMRLQLETQYMNHHPGESAAKQDEPETKPAEQEKESKPEEKPAEPQQEEKTEEKPAEPAEEPVKKKKKKVIVVEVDEDEDEEEAVQKAIAAEEKKD